MRIFAIDPAKPATKRGYALIQGAHICAGAAAIVAAREIGAVDWVVCEDQWLVPETQARRARAAGAKVGGMQSVMTLRLYAGLLLGRWGERLRARTAVLPVAAWKGALFGAGFASAPKAVFTANLRQEIARRGFAVPSSDDDVDACGIALAAASGMIRLEDYEVK